MLDTLLHIPDAEILVFYPLVVKFSYVFWALDYDPSLPVYTIASNSVQTLQSRLRRGVFELVAVSRH
jgi:hypothetical protein